MVVYSGFCQGDMVTQLTKKHSPKSKIGVRNCNVHGQYSKALKLTQLHKYITFYMHLRLGRSMMAREEGITDRG